MYVYIYIYLFIYVFIWLVIVCTRFAIRFDASATRESRRVSNMEALLLCSQMRRKGDVQVIVSLVVFVGEVVVVLVVGSRSRSRIR